MARLLRPPATAGDGGAAAALAAQNLLTEKLCGTRARLTKAWFVHERDTLALALGGRFETFDARFGDDCGDDLTNTEYRHVAMKVVEYFTIRCGAENRADSRSVTVARRRGAFAETER